MNKIDLNCDLGESFGVYSIGGDEEVIPYITSANIACGFHAGDALVMEKTIGMCIENGTAVGAHPGFPDLIGFGRRNLDANAKEFKAYVTYQIGALYAFCKSRGIKLEHVKPHGAMYNMAAKDYKLALAIAEAIGNFDNNLIFLGLSGSLMLKAAKEVGIRAASEVFADRGYEEDGSLVKRGTQGDMITDTELAINRVVRMVKDGTVEAKSGKIIEIEANSVCVHGDGAEALEFVKRISEKLKDSGIKLAPLSQIV